MRSRRGSMTVFSVLTGVVASAIGGCSILVSIDGLSGGATADGPTADSTEPSDARIDDSIAERSADGDAARPCPGSAGPPAIRIGEGSASFCIDTTEVTNAQYATFLSALPSIAAQPAICSWNTQLVPAARWPIAAGDEDLPVAGVDWCDALAYCSWAGKRLCGKIGGGSLPSSERTDPTKSEWMFACSRAGSRNYPYGSSYATAACNGADSTGRKPAPVGTSPACSGGFAGLLDMSGSIAEWEDSCASVAGGANDSCAYRGGEYGHAPSALTCSEVEVFPRNALEPSGGFRCCGS